MTGFFQKRTAQEKRLLVALTLLLIAFITALEYWTGAKIQLTIIYLLPVLLAASISKSTGIVIAIASATIGVAAGYILEHRYDGLPFYLWDFASHAAVFLLAAVLRANLLASREQQGKLARIDPLTGALNGRAFREFAQAEIDRAARYDRPLTVAYLDVDNFKTVNDTQGHSEGDALLCAMVSGIKKRIRKTDAIARLGGDEFAVLFPETGQESALQTIHEIQEILTREVRKRDWPVTFSIGVLTVTEEQPSINQLIEASDALMYQAKQGGKDAICAGYFPKKQKLDTHAQ